MTHGIDARVYPNQAAQFDATGNRTPTDPELQQLLPTDVTMLSPAERCDLTVRLSDFARYAGLFRHPPQRDTETPRPPKASHSFYEPHEVIQGRGVRERLAARRLL